MVDNPRPKTQVIAANSRISPLPAALLTRTRAP